MASYQNITNTLNFSVAFNPTSAFPIDARSMFGTLAAAEAAAATAVNAGSADSVYYFGQILTVFENDVAKHYSIQGDKTLKEVGASIATDDKTIVMNGEVLSLKDFGTRYYAYHNADKILPSDESYVFPGTMPAGEAGAYVQVAGVWYKYDDSAWAAAGADPKTQAYYTMTEGWKAGLEPKVVSLTEGGYGLAWYEPSTTTVEGLNSAVGSLQTEVNTLDTKVQGLTTAVDTLNSGAEVEGSVKNQVNAAIAEVVAGAPDDLNTLKELADWITTHGAEAAQMNSDILANSTAITALETLVGTLPEGTSATTVIGYIAEAIAAAGENYATKEQGAKADTAVQKVVAGDNGHIKVDDVDVTVYTPAAASTSTAGVVKVDGTSITATEAGVISVEAVDKSKVTGLDDALTQLKTDTLADAKTAADEAYVAKTSVVADGSIAADMASASDTKVISEKAFLAALTWKEGM